MSTDFDVCVVGSGAGGGPIAYRLAKAGYSVLVLEKGPWLKEKDFFKDELACCRRLSYFSNQKDEPRVIELEDEDNGGWKSQPTPNSGWHFWNGNLVGGASNFMSGFFHRLKPVDFRLLSEFGPVDGGNVVDWPITYDDLEPYYDLVEKVVGVSGRVVKHPHQEPRSSTDFAYPPIAEHAIAGLVDKACDKLGFHSIPTPRAVLPYPDHGRKGCSYNGYCGSYGCATGAKGSSRAALLDHAVTTGRCEVRPNCMVSRIDSDASGKVTSVEYIDAQGGKRRADAKIYVLAAQALETPRLLLNSVGPKHPNGLANGSGQVGRNLLFAGGGAGSGMLPYAKFGAEQIEALKQTGPFVNRALQDWYVIEDEDSRMKGGTIDFVHAHPNPVARAARQMWGSDGLIWGKPLKRKLEAHFREGRYIKIEAFCDWMPNDDCYVSLDRSLKDKWGLPVSKIRVNAHVRNLIVGWQLASKGADVLREMGAENVVSFASGAPPTNLVAGTTRFGKDPATSVLDPDCRAHEVENLFITDSSFMPTGGSVPYTWTIYANSFRVAEKIVAQLGGDKERIS